MRICNSKVVGLAFGVGLAIAASTITASATTLIDGTFGSVNTSQPQWAPTGTTGSFSVCGTCGNTGAALEALFTSTVSSSFFAGQVAIDGALQYNPSTQGAITSLSASADKYVAITGFSGTQGNSLRLLIQQGGNYYLDAISEPSWTAPGNSGWLAFVVSGLTASNFTQICVTSCGPGNFGANIYGPSHPNFSGTGGNILFGVEFQTSALLAGENINARYDNLEFDINTPLPSTWFMLLSGFVGLGFFAHRGTKKNSAALAAA